MKLDQIRRVESLYADSQWSFALRFRPDAERRRTSAHRLPGEFREIWMKHLNSLGVEEEEVSVLPLLHQMPDRRFRAWDPLFAKWMRIPIELAEKCLILGFFPVP